MRVKVLFHGILTDWVGTAEADFALREGSPFADLMALIGRRYCAKMPEQLWDKGSNSFVKAVWAMAGEQRIVDPKRPLKEGDMIKFLLTQAGG
jgi:molybdopterin converting factor small subunit